MFHSGPNLIDLWVHQFEPNEGDLQAEKAASLALLSKLDHTDPSSTSKKPRKEGKDDILNVRKAVRYETKGKGATALAGKASSGKKDRAGGKKGKR
jgi:regulator of ribosome biosynthesis